ncbi:MAG: serine hydrolase [Spirochaetales bacterium]|nr:serine hydrolase [Spirochaetales bacterium]
MTRRRLVGSGILVFLLAAAITLVGLLAPIGSGYAAKYLCSQIFVSGRSDARQIIDEEITPTHPMFQLVSSEVDFQNKTVRSVTGLIFEPTLAVYRDGFGCTLATGTDRQALLEQGAGFKRPEDLPEAFWPAGEKVPTADPRLAQVLDQAFMEPASGRRQTQAVAIVHRGQLIAERYAPGFHEKTPVLGWSMSKTVTAALFGILKDEKKIDLDSPARVAEWENDPARKGITPRHLLQMSSGLNFSEVYAPFGDAPEMLYAHGDMAAYAATRDVAHSPGTHWYYSSGDTNILARMLRMETGGTAVSARQFARERLFDPLHMQTAIIEPDASGTFVGSSYMYASARDWARFALLLLQDGRFEGKQILPAGWVAFMRTPVPDSGGQYGAQTWLNAGHANSAVEETRRFRRLPASTFYLSGYNGQNVFILPEEELIVVRLGVTHERKNWSIEDFVVQVREALNLK